MTIISSNSTISSAYNLFNEEGVTTQLYYGAEEGSVFWQPADVIADLNYLDIHTIRDADLDGSAAVNSAFESVACNSSGVVQNKLVMLISGPRNYEEADLTDGSYPLTSRINAIKSIDTACSGSVIGVEGPNEINNYPIAYQATVSNSTYGIVAGTNYGYTGIADSTPYANPQGCNQ